MLLALQTPLVSQRALAGLRPHCMTALPPGYQHSRVQPAAPLGILGLAFRASPVHSSPLSSLYGSAKGGRFLWGTHCLSLSLSPGALGLRPSSEVMGQTMVEGT